MTKNYLIAYDICDPKRLYKVAKMIYAQALGGQKSSLEAPLRKNELIKVIEDLENIIEDEDKVHIIPIQGEPLLFGKAKSIPYDKGVIIV